jgi:hypothetical protein
VKTRGGNPVSQAGQKPVVLPFNHLADALGLSAAHFLNSAFAKSTPGRTDT